MKHLLLLLVGLTLTGFVFSQKVVDTLTSYQFANNAWQPNARSINHYNSSCILDTSTGQEWVARLNAWRNASRTIYTYSNDLVSKTVVQTWDTTANIWINAIRLSYTYNTNNKITVTLSEFWDTSSNAWVPLARTTNSYNANNLVDSTLSELNFLGQWQNASLTINHYNANNLVDTTTNQTWNAIAWANSTRTIDTYNADNSIHETIHQTWNLTAWANQYRDAFTYNGSKLVVTDTTQRWNNSTWSDSALIINTYNGTQLTNTLDQEWDNASSTWVNVRQTNYTYNGDGTIAQAITQNWDAGTAAWVNDSRTDFHYSATCTLPLTLLDFTAALNGKAAQLQWTTSTEINTKNFVVQRSIDGTHFQNIGTVTSVGNSTQRTSYQFSDAGAANAGANKVYYRLQMVDRDGKFTYSKIATITIVNGKLFVIYPNPVKDQLLITSNAPLNNSQIRITDQSGRVVYQQQIVSMQAGIPNKINVSALNKGVYYVQLLTGTDVETTKFLKY